MRNSKNSVIQILICLTISLWTGQAAAQSAGVDLEVVMGKSLIVEAPAAFDTVLVGDPDVVELVLMRDNQFYLLGKKIGTTNLQVLDDNGEIISLYNVRTEIDTSFAELAVKKASGNESISLISASGNLILSGSISSDDAREEILTTLANFTDRPIVDALTVEDPKQVSLKVEIIEATRAAARLLGANLTSINLNQTGAINFGSSGITGDTTFNLVTTLNAMERNGYARFLASPTLTAVSGQEASFLAGGELPLPTGGEDIGVIYREFGVRLLFTPTVRRNDLINLQLEPEVSQIDAANSYNVDGRQIPAFLTRKASTSVELRSGESLLIAGLIQDSTTRRNTGIPELKNLPIIGALFRETSLDDSNTELMIIITPTIVTRDEVYTPAGNSPLNDRASSPESLSADGTVSITRDNRFQILLGTGAFGSYGPIITPDGEGAFVSR
jgi:pilus assembly protein CpaC